MFFLIVPQGRAKQKRCRGIAFAGGACFYGFGGQGFRGLHQEDADPVEDEGADDVHEEEPGQVGRKGLRVDAGHREVGKADVVEHLGSIGMQDDEDEQHHRQRQQQARQAAQHRGQGCNGQHGQYGEPHAYKAAQLHGKEAVLDVALHGEQHDVAQKHQPAVIKFNDVEERVGDQDPHQHHQAEIEQKTLGNGFVHKREPPFLVLERKKCAAPVYRVLRRLASFDLQNKQLNLALKPTLLSRGFSSIMEL